MYKRFKNSALNAAQNLGVLSNLHYFDISSVNALYVLVYHRVDWENAQLHLDPMNLSATPEQFDQHMRLIAEEYHAITSDQLLEAVIQNKRLPTRSVLVTVDDGYLDFKKHIWPIAKRYGIRPVLFVPTAYVGTGVFWWDKLYDALQHTDLQEVDTPIGRLALRTKENRQTAFAKLADYMKQSPFKASFAEIDDLTNDLLPDHPVVDRATLDWDDLRELVSAGVTIAPHTHNHPALGNIDPEEVKFEIQESQRLIKSKLDVHSTIFAYPYGSRSAIGSVAGDILRDLGFHTAFTMKLGRASLNVDDHLYLPRIPIYPNMSLSQFHVKLTPIVEISTRKNQTKSIQN